MSERDYENGWQDGYLECLNLGEENRLIKEFDKGRKQGAVEVQNKTNEIILDLLCQGCHYNYTDRIIDNLCISAYEDACDYLKEQGILKEINPRTYKIIKEKKRGV
jgi:hypothetical protein